MLKTIIINELEKRLNRTATAAEQHDVWLNIGDTLTESDTFADLMAAMNDYISDNYTHCDVCGEMHRLDDVTEIDGPYGCYTVCQNPDCHSDAYYGANHNHTREWATY